MLAGTSLRAAWTATRDRRATSGSWGSCCATTGPEPVRVTRMDPLSLTLAGGFWGCRWYRSAWGDEFRPQHGSTRHDTVLEVRAGRSVARHDARGWAWSRRRETCGGPAARHGAHRDAGVERQLAHPRPGRGPRDRRHLALGARRGAGGGGGASRPRRGPRRRAPPGRCLARAPGRRARPLVAADPVHRFGARSSGTTGGRTRTRRSPRTSSRPTPRRPASWASRS